MTTPLEIVPENLSDEMQWFKGKMEREAAALYHQIEVSTAAARMQISQKLEAAEHRLWLQMTALDERLSGRIDAVDGRLDAVDGRLDAVDGRLDAVEKRLDAVENRMGSIEEILATLVERFDRMDARLDALEAARAN